MTSSNKTLTNKAICNACLESTIKKMIVFVLILIKEIKITMSWSVPATGVRSQVVPSVNQQASPASGQVKQEAVSFMSRIAFAW